MRGKLHRSAPRNLSASSPQAPTGAAVDVWHANAAGTYSDIAREGTAGPSYLRGVQVTDAAGRATFTTIYPGWYSGRAVHVHFKVRLFDGSSTTYEFTSQLFFDPATTDDVYATSAYSSRGTPNTPNSTDDIYGSDGSKLLVALTPDGSGTPTRAAPRRPSAAPWRSRLAGAAERCGSAVPPVAARGHAERPDARGAVLEQPRRLQLRDRVDDVLLVELRVVGHERGVQVARAARAVGEDDEAIQRAVGIRDRGHVVAADEVQLAASAEERSAGRQSGL
jgi:hypothetical protein